MATIQTKWIDVGSYSFKGASQYGYNSALSYGTISNTQNGSSNVNLDSVYSGADVEALAWYDGSSLLTLQLSGTHANSGWATISIGGVSFSRSAASHSQSSGSTYWSWSSVSSNPFGTTTGADKEIIWDDGALPTTYSVTAPASINEGSSGTMNVSTTNVANGTTLYWTVEPSGDFGTSSGSFSISSNAGSFTVTPSADQTTEGAETGTIRIRTGSTSGTIVASDTFTINDTSTTPGPTYSVTAPASINEGSAGTMNVSTTNVSNGTTLYWTVTPSGDFGTSSGNFTINSNAGSFTVTPSADQTTEGSETGTIQIRTGSTSGTIVASDTFTINDTSTTPAVPTFSVAANPTSVNEGQTVTFTLTTTNVPNGRTVGYTVTGITSNDLSSGSLTGSFSVSSNSAQVQVTLANDSTTEGPETMTLTCDSTDSSGASTGSPSTSVSISDTSTGSGSSGGGSGSLSGSTGTYGLKIFGANGSSVVFSPSHRTFQVIAGGRVTLAASGSTTVSNIANATDPTKVSISVMSDLAGSLQVAYTRNANSTVTFTNQSSGAGVTFRYHIYRIG